MHILFKNKNVIVAYKPPGIPSQSDKSGDESIMELLQRELSVLGENDALWLVHRLDRTVGGLMAFARSKESAAALSLLVSQDRFTKEYLAVARGTVQDGEYTDYLFKDSTVSKSFVVKTLRRGAKEATLSLENLKSLSFGQMTLSLLRVRLKTGRFHQIRAQLSHRGAPLLGDKKYGGAAPGVNNIALFAYHISFVLFDEKIDVKMLPPADSYPWNLFEGEVKSLE